jgi:linoleate 10R-lipoxygenase
MSRAKKSEHHDIVKRLYELDHSNEQLANTLLALMVSSVELSLGARLFTFLRNAADVLIVLTNVIHCFLGSGHAATIASLVKSPEGKAKLDAYVYEALRKLVVELSGYG